MGYNQVTLPSAGDPEEGEVELVPRPLPSIMATSPYLYIFCTSVYLLLLLPYALFAVAFWL